MTAAGAAPHAILAVPRLPGTGFTGDRVRAEFHLGALARAGFRTTLVGGLPPGCPLPAVTGAARVAGVPLHPLSFGAGLVSSAIAGRPLQTAFAAGPWRGPLREAGEADLVVVLLARLHPLVAPHLPPAPRVLDYVDALSEAARQASAQDPHPLRRAYWRLEAPRLGRAERDAAKGTALLLATTARDAAFLPEGTVGIPHGVAIGAPPPAGPRPPVVAFVGRLGYRPNEVAARRLALSVWPRVRAAVPGASLLLAGADAPAWMHRLDGTDGIRVESPAGDVPALLRRVRVVAAPLSIGTGTPNKLFEALEAGTAFVGLPEVAARAALPGAPPPPVGSAPDDEALAALLVQYLSDPARAEADGSLGREWVERHASRADAEERLAGLLLLAAEGVG